MNLFSSGPIEAANQDANARMNPVRQQDLEAGLFSGIPTAAGQAIGGVINRASMIATDTLTPMLTPMAKSLDRVFKSDLNGYLLREQEKTHQAARDLTPDPAVVGWVGQNLIYGGASILGDVAVGTLATGNPFAGLAYAAGAQGYQAYGGAKDSGLNTQTALGMAGITGASTFLGGFVPVWLGQGVATNLMGRAMLAEVSGKAATASGLYGAASLAAVASTNTAAKLGTAGLLQTATGIPTRASISALLEANGYPDMAKQYHAFSLSEMVSDFAIGSIFGLGVHGYQKAFVDRVPPAKPSDLNAALALNNASHVELGTAPGIPVTPEARAAHVEAVNKAISDLLGDRPVEVGDSVTKADFIENPSAAETRAQIVRVVEQHMGPEWEGLQAQLRERGLPENTELYDIQPGPSPVRVTDNVRSMIAEFEKTGDTGALLERLRTLGGKLEQRVEANAAKGEGDLTRGNLWIRERLIRAERNGEITPEAHTLVKWLLDNNPAIADELAISFRKGGDGVNGTYNPFQKLVTLFKNRGNDLTAAHEVLHHTERMMPEAVRDGIREEWLNQLHALQKWASENQVHDLMRAIDDVIRATAGDEAAAKRVNDLIKDGTLPYEFYQYVNPSEFWAVNAARLVADRAGANGWVAKAVQWLKEFIEKAKSAFGLNSDAAIIRGLDAVLKSDGKISGNMLLQGGMSFNDMARGKAGPDAPGVGVAKENLNGFEPDLRVRVPIGNLKLPTNKAGNPEALMLAKTNIKNAGKQIAAIDKILAKFPNADQSPLEWSKMMAYALATNDVPIPPYRFLKDINSDGAFKSLSRLSAGQISDANHGFENAQVFREAYTSKQLDSETTGKLFMWSFLSRGVSPYVQEGLFIDAFPGVDNWIKRAADGRWDENARETYNIGDKAARERLADTIYQADVESYEAAKKAAEKKSVPLKVSEPQRIEWQVNDDGTVNMTWSEWARTVAPKGSGQPGSGATHNLNAFGNLFLAKMSVKDKNGVSLLQKMHDMMEDPNMTGKELRRWFLQNTEGVGIDNKVVSFTLLVAGFKDVMVLDRVQIRQLWDDGRFSGRNLYDGRKENGKAVAGSALSDITYGARGLLIYEAIERALEKRIENLYTSLGRPEDASIGRYHWETWVADSQQEASHGTLDAILHDAQGNRGAIAEVTAKEGEYGGYAYGARYGRDDQGQPYFLYSTPMGNEYRFTVEGFREFLEAVKSPSNKVVPSKFKVTEAGNAPWYDKPEVNKQALDALAKRYAGEPGTGQGAGAVRADGPGQAVPDSAGRGTDPYGADATIRNNPALTIAGEDGAPVPAGRALAQSDAEIAQAKQDSQGYDAAVACALRG